MRIIKRQVRPVEYHVAHKIFIITKKKFYMQPTKKKSQVAIAKANIIL